MSAALLLMICGAAGSPAAWGKDTYWERRVTLFDKLPIFANDIVFLGNSITDGGEFAELFDMENIKNRGIVSDVISGVEKRLHQVTKTPPKKIFLLIGINDVSHGLDARRIAEKYEHLVRRIRSEAPQTQLYVQSVMPIDNSFRRYRNLLGRERVIPELNGMLKEISARNGAIYLDLWPALADPKTGSMKKGFTNDGLHLTGAGYRAWTDLIRPYVTDSPLPSSQTDSSK